ncbi:DUF6965 family protein [Olivibacter sitiensis]|uniref:DUF6965 family protein n=1 Tax=Olivibacter sitiensis TaxID=376470 RepID=UPI0004111931|nr:hypothetical protein [Olivibacter sitiensis]
MTPAELKEFFDNRQLPAEMAWHPWSMITDMKRFLSSNFQELAEIMKRGDYTKSPAYWHLMELKEILEKTESQKND